MVASSLTYSNDMGYLSWLQAEMLEDPAYLLLIPYIVGQPLFRRFVTQTDIYEKHKPFFKNVMGAYNLMMSVFSVCCSACIFYCLFFTIPTELIASDHFAEPSGLYRRVSYFFYLSKYVEFLDTFFLILCSRPVSWLQYFHHIGAVLDMGFLYYGENSGIWIFVGFNGIIHTVMYYYYACAILKWKFTLMPKNCITIMQLVQFFGGMSIYYPYTGVPEFWNDVRNRNTWLYTYFYVITLIFLFANFYLNTYVFKAKQNGAVAGNENVKKGVSGAAVPPGTDTSQKTPGGNARKRASTPEARKPPQEERR